MNSISYLMFLKLLLICWLFADSDPLDKININLNLEDEEKGSSVTSEKSALRPFKTKNGFETLTLGDLAVRGLAWLSGLLGQVALKKKPSNNHIPDKPINSVGCKTVTKKSCVFPFTYKGKTHNKCTNIDSENGAVWCATNVDKNGEVIRNTWDDCGEGCPGTGLQQQWPSFGQLPPVRAYILKSNGGTKIKYPKLMGVYEASEEIHNNFPVYNQVDGSGLIYVDSHGSWVVGKDTTNGYAKMYSSERPVLQSPPATQWHYANHQQWIRDSTLTVIPTNQDLTSLWIKGNNVNCWDGCRKKGGLCVTVCGPRGYCCRKGWNDCSKEAQKLAFSNYHSCVIKSVTRGNTPSPTPLFTPLPQSSACLSCSENVESLSSARISSLTEAMRNLHASSDWERVASIHGVPVRGECGFRLCCIHGEIGGGFLPWHRAYMDSFNTALGTIFPYWDWTTSSFPSIAHSGPFSGGLQVFNGRNTNRSSSSVSTRGNLDAVLAALEEDDFLLFSTQLEDIHDAIHVRVGGSMGSLAIASYDPIFFLHHSFVDLVWAVYQILKPNVQARNLGRRLVPFGRTIGQTLSTNRYNLDINSNRIVFGGMTLAQIQNRISSRTRESGVQGENRVYAGFFKRSYGTSGIIHFNICNGDYCSYPGGEVNIFGGRKQMSYINSDPTKVDITDAVNKAGIDNLKQLRFKITSFINLNGRPIRETIYAPIRIVRPGNGGRNPDDTGSNDGYCVIFNQHFPQPPKLRIPKNTMLEVESPYQNVIETTNRNSYINCYQTDGISHPSKTPLNVNPGTYYFFDDDCKHASKLQIVKE